MTPPLHGFLFTLLSVILLAGCDARPPAARPTPGTDAAPAPSEPVSSPFHRLLGEWERPDGGYVLELASVDAEGRFAAAYFNPAPVHVEQARGAIEADGLKVFIVLRDVNYPGCVYRLAYDPAADQLFGTYFQAAMGATYDVAFSRRKPGTP